jgi:transposase
MAEQRANLPDLMAKGAEASGFIGDVWTTARVAEVIRREFGVRHHPAHVSRILRALRWTAQRPVRRAQAVQAFLAAGAAARLHREQLPGYAPELNPAAGVWNQLKRGELKNRCCQTLDELRWELGLAIRRLRRRTHLLTACVRQCGYV